MSLTQRELSRFDGHAYPRFNFSVKKKKEKKARMYCDTDENDDLVLKKNIMLKKKNCIPTRSQLRQALTICCVNVTVKRFFSAACYVACAWLRAPKPEDSAFCESTFCSL